MAEANIAYFTPWASAANKTGVPWSDLSKKPLRVDSGGISQTCVVSDLVFVGAFAQHGVRFTRSVLPVVSVDTDKDGVWVATTYLSEIHGVGTSPKQAAFDLVSSLAEHYRWMEDNSKRLSDDFNKELSALRGLLVIENE